MAGEAADGKKKKFDDKPFEKGGEHDCSDGPVKKRGCTDIPCCLLFLAHWAAFGWLCYWAYMNGQPRRLIAPRDYKGNFCGWDGNWGPWMVDNTKYDQVNYPYMMYSMNVSAMLDDVARVGVCNAGTLAWWNLKHAESSLAGNDNEFTTEEWMARCGNLVPDADALQDAADAIKKYFDPKEAAGLLLGSGGSSLLAEIAKYFTPICVKSCSAITAFNKVDASNRTAVGGVPWNYRPAGDAKWGGVLDLLYDHDPSVTSVPPLAGWQTLKGYLEGWSALPKDQCGGDSKGTAYSKHCIPFIGLEFSRIGNICMFSLGAEATEALSEAGAAAVDGMMETGVAASSRETMGNAWGDVQIVWPALLITTLLSVCIGFAFLVLLRFIIGPLIWGSIFLVFALLVAGAVYFYLLATECKAGSPPASNLVANQTSNDRPAGADDTCTNGYAIENKQDREYYMYIAYILLAFAAIYALIICCIAKKIALAIAINKVAAKFVYQTKPVILVPIITIVCVLAWMIGWLILAMYIVSAFDNNSAPNESYTYEIAYGVDASCWLCNDGVAGYCTNTWPTGWTWKDDVNNDKCLYYFDQSSNSGGYGNGVEKDSLCWRCALPRWFMGREFAFAFFSFLWNNAFICACCTMTIAGAVGFWYFTPNDEKGTRAAVRPAFTNCFRYHLGSIAFGSFILAVVQFIKWWLYYLEKQAEAGKNKLMVTIAKSLRCCITCFEKFIKFLNKNAYIQCALLGKNFCRSAYNAYSLLMRNAGLVGLLAGIGWIVYILGVICITISTAVAGYYIIDYLHGEEISNPVIPVLICIIIGFLVSKLFMGVFALAVDATLQCFVADEELHKAGGGGGAQFTPEELKPFVHEKGGGGCCG
jgi:hypothetical protein